VYGRSEASSSRVGRIVQRGSVVHGMTPRIDTAGHGCLNSVSYRGTLSAENQLTPDAWGSEIRDKMQTNQSTDPFEQWQREVTSAATARWASRRIHAFKSMRDQHNRVDVVYIRVMEREKTLGKGAHQVNGMCGF
jgi:hypothetical protein